MSRHISGSTFAQFLSSLSEHGLIGPGVRRRAGQIPEGKANSTRLISLGDILYNRVELCSHVSSHIHGDGELFCVFIFMVSHLYTVMSLVPHTLCRSVVGFYLVG